MQLSGVLIMNEKIRYGIIGTIVTLLIFGGATVLTNEELDHAWYCDNHGRVGIFERMSSTNKSGYWHNEDGLEKRATCTKSEWIPLRDYCEEQNITNCQRISNKVTAKEDVWTKKYWCTDTCDEIYK